MTCVGLGCILKIRNSAVLLSDDTDDDVQEIGYLEEEEVEGLYMLMPEA